MVIDKCAMVWYHVQAFTADVRVQVSPRPPKTTCFGMSFFYVMAFNPVALVNGCRIVYNEFMEYRGVEVFSMARSFNSSDAKNLIQTHRSLLAALASAANSHDARTQEVMNASCGLVEQEVLRILQICRRLLFRRLRIWTASARKARMPLKLSWMKSWQRP